ncbi:S1C family serine protease [Butyrivibrio sp. MC2021]|uniref:S1C family serine protease n=1 Tax=Butyrivibrio sp. MC2021 TaxID=1408306 RepID=UPI000688E41C|nr:S1C family serine protease [Butyrivibrio sp. MC2021]
MPLNNDENKKAPLANTDFISEKIKQRPINKKKLFRRTMITVTLAVLFGIVACFTFLFLQPVFSDRMFPEKEPEEVSFPAESASDELTPEEMFADDNEIAASEAQSFEASQKDQIDEAIASYAFDSSDYGKMMNSLKDLATTANRSMVKVTAVTSDANWFSESFENSGTTSGVIVADNGISIFILAPYSAVEEAESIRVTFCDNTSAQATIRLADSISRFCVITVRHSVIPDGTMDHILVAPLGSSNSNSITGRPVIAVGSPIGVQDSIAYGIITSEKMPLDMADSDYKLLTTDILGSSSGSGALINLTGQVVGIIDMSHATEDLKNNICAVGITELKSLIEDLSNLHERAYLGVHGTTIPDDIRAQQNIPAGAYITQTELNSPAMKAGIQSGDIITAIDDVEVASYELLVNKLAGFKPDDIITVTVMRQAPSDYISLDIEVTLESSTHN